MPLLYSVLLLLLFYLLLVGEFLLPTGGLMGFAAVAALISMLVIAFSHSMAAGVTMSIIVLISSPILMFGLVRIWPHTPIGRRMLNRRPGELASPPTARTTRSGIPLDKLVGRTGIAKSDLLPSGMILIDGEKLDACSIGMPIEAGHSVIVTRFVAGRIQVRRLTEEEQQSAATDSIGDSMVVPQSPPSLEQSLESLDFD
ncbi:hypothetical protein K227x_28470 [Rubripirellula lacrimiformis]|uniref:NfeD-like C-terminal domain-containing protein n=1 Tax=Rubripirellula lacrimiformis TaxID=1930273 RepID=A0A517NBE8_9BACT|nr:NfeD family protein [Rubripirellula lacrimiformis]QDT04456.1 hypothetical protein K227x_28470 [Rubripirellula lacrimiformis]